MGDTTRKRQERKTIHRLSDTWKIFNAISHEQGYAERHLKSKTESFIIATQNTCITTYKMKAKVGKTHKICCPVGEKKKGNSKRNKCNKRSLKI